jgi:hypothetical protein
MAKNPVAPRDLETSQTPETDSLDPTQATFFIKYEPEIAEKLSNLKKAGVSVSGRCLSVVFSRLYYWSKYAKHRFENKLYFWKSQKELGEETGFSEKQINRALKALVDLGLLVRDKFHRRFWRQVYFYHVPISPFTKEIERKPRPMGQATRATSSRPIHAQTPPVNERTPRAASGACGPAAGGPGGLSRALGAAQAAGAAPRAGKINGAKGFGTIRAKCPDLSTEDSTSKKQTSRSPFQNIIQRCEFYGTAENYERIFGKSHKFR